jgi:hypothetical protein
VNGALAIVIEVCGAGAETLNLALGAFYRCAAAGVRGHQPTTGLVQFKKKFTEFFKILRHIEFLDT